MSDYRHWTSDEEKYIQEHWRLQTDGEMAAALDRSEGAVRTKRRDTSPILPDVRRGVPGAEGTDLLPEVSGHAEKASSEEICRAPRKGPAMIQKLSQSLLTTTKEGNHL